MGYGAGEGKADMEGRVLKPSGLLCEYACNPIGIDTQRPRFAWSAINQGRGGIQTAYRVLVASTLENLESGVADMWDSGRVETSRSMNIAYSGNPLNTAGIYYWKVCIWDGNGCMSSYSDTSTFEMGLLEKQDWKGFWVAHPGGRSGASLLFRKSFTADRPVARARVYISGLGYYELSINGKRVGDHVLDPGCTDYSKRVLYVTYDITGHLVEGPNVLGVMLGNGWYSTISLLVQANIEYADGTTQSFQTGPHGSGWLCTAGPILENSVFDGEIYDARREIAGWDTPEYENDITNLRRSGWVVPYAVGGPGGRLKAQTMEPIKVVEERKPIGFTNPEKNIYVFDMGQNMAGWIRLKVLQALRGTEITLRFSETLYDTGTVNQENLRSALARDVYITKGGGSETYEPRFTYHGFRYIQVEGFPGIPTMESVTGCVVRTSVEKIGDFECSNDLINRIYSNVVWTEAGNLHSIPTDCPQRDERQGWLNDATVRAEESVYNFNMSRFFPKWIEDIGDTQDPGTGAITDTAPYKWGLKPADPVSSSYLVIPWLIYQHYWDERVLESNYEGMKKWNEFLGNSSDNYIVNYSYYGDWASPKEEAVEGSLGDGAVSAVTPGILMSTGYYYYNSILLSKMARILGKEEDVWKYASLADKIRDAFNKRFLDTEKGRYAKGSQASNVFPLYLDLVPEQYRNAVLSDLLQDVVEKRDYHLSTGNLCTKYLLEMLTEEGYGEVAYRLVTQVTYPSWGYMISQGATTIWERWEYATGGAMNSHNHPMLATVGSWFFKYLAGILVQERNPGFGRFSIRPYVLGDLKHVKASLKTIRGTIESCWKRKDDTFELTVTIPFNSSAEVHIPKLPGMESDIAVREGGTLIWYNGKPADSAEGIKNLREADGRIVLEAGAGTYHFSCTSKR